jgi:hypothetical protein
MVKKDYGVGTDKVFDFIVGTAQIGWLKRMLANLHMLSCRENSLPTNRYFLKTGHRSPGFKLKTFLNIQNGCPLDA